MTALDRTNRLVVSLLGLLLFAIGAYGLLRGAGALGERAAEDPLRTPGLASAMARNDGWIWAVVAAVSVLVAVAALSWLRAQLTPSASLSVLAVAGGGGVGETHLDASAVADAVAADAEAHPSVERARVRVVPDGGDLALDVRVELADGAELAPVRARIEGEVVGRARTALGRPDLRAQVRFRLGDPAARTLR